MLPKAPIPLLLLANKRMLEGVFILSWKVFNLVRKCCVSDNVHGNQKPILTSQIIINPRFNTASKEDKHTALVGFAAFI